MARNREKKGSLVHQVKAVFDGKLAIGRSKFEDKKAGLSDDKIYSWSTYKSYLKHSVYFVEWAKKTYNIKSLDESKKYVNEWLEKRDTEDNLSSYTVKLETSSLIKLFGLSKDEVYTSKNRVRSDISRSRGEKKRDKFFSEENHSELVEFCRSVGLRRGELQQIKGSDLIYINDKPFINVTRNTKGGRSRLIPIIINTDFVVQKFKNAGDNKLFDTIPNGADIHGYRADFATALYKRLAHDVSELPKSDKYFCRKDLKGVCWDKQAMLKVSQALGHNRISVIAGHYIRRD